ncbi:protein PSK SIMULATOR 1 [Benincasa hispida]|uniref:protein PSK SIMULATOR 1 n=1 Tax=Benincasa hispida TaxID=102211 RepID=UPI0019009CC0|nr:protein PSK SIMULATOR 1 [Benincasa hispida]
MALETWLIKVKNAVSNKFDVVRTSSTTVNFKPTSSKKSPNVGVLAFEIAGLMSKLLHLWNSLSDDNIIRLRNESISLEGVHKIVSNDDDFLLALACAEITENLRLLANSVSRLCIKCDHPDLRSFHRLFNDFADSGRDLHNWILSEKEMECRNKRIERLVTVTSTLHREMDELSIMETGLRKAVASLQSCQQDQNQISLKEQKILDLQQKILWQRQEVKYLKEKSLWNRTFDTVMSILARSIFTTLARIKLVFGLASQFPSSLPRSLSASAAVHPLKNLNDNAKDSDPITKNAFFESNSKLLKPPPTTLGAAGLALHYANLIIVMDKMIKSPQLVGVDARDDLYSMLPNSIRSSLRARLRGVGFTASDPSLAGEWREAMERILGWMSPLAQNMIKWQSERSFEQQNYLALKTNVMLLQTLYFANKDKTEAAITELLVGLNYIWRFEREMTAKALFASNNFITT